MKTTTLPAQNLFSTGYSLPLLGSDASEQRRASRRISPALLAISIRCAEVMILALLGLCIASVWVSAPDAFENSRYLTAIFATTMATSVVMQRFKLFTVPALAQPLRALPRFALAWTVAMALLIATVFLLKSGPMFSRGWLLLWYAAGLLGLTAFRYMASRAVRRWSNDGRLKRNAIIFGAGPEGAELVAALEATESDVHICGLFDDRGAEDIDERLKRYTMLGTADDLIDYCRRHPVDMLIVSLPFSAEKRLLDTVRKLWVLPVDIRLSAGGSKLRFHPRAYSFVGNVPLIDVFDKPLAEWDVFVKSVFDRIVAAIALVVLAPVMAAVALAIRLDSKGPVLFCQKRLGFNNEPIDVFKFRSMYTDMADVTASRLVTRNDSRVTPVGRFIRKTSLDELPQLFNVLAGSLSLVGPRPHAIHAKADNRLYHDVVDDYFARHKVKPGMTGWAQINGWRGETDTAEKIEKRVEHDLYYVENWSLMLDILILLKTPISLVQSKNAY